MQICIFEDNSYKNFEPLIYYRPVYDLVCGIKSLREKILRAYPNIKYALHCREYLYDFVKVNNPKIDINIINDNKCLFINGKIIAPYNMSEIIPLDGEDKVYKNNDTIIAARVSGKNLERISKNLNNVLFDSIFNELPVEKIDIKYADFIWHLIAENGNELRIDFAEAIKEKKKNNIKGKVFDGAYLLEKENIIIEEGAAIKPGAVLDASKGPIFIDKNAVVSANSVIENTVYLGENSAVKSCSVIYDNVSIQNTCKAGGEVEDSVIMPYSNKQHAGFLGHTYLGSWVNIGADTNCSDLKNNYSNIKVYTNGKEVDTKMQFLGLIMGDHSKTAINTMFNTGTIAGFSCSIFGADFPDKYIPSFSWGGSNKFIEYDPDKSIETAKRMIQRRKKEMTDKEEILFKKIFKLTEDERKKRGY